MAGRYRSILMILLALGGCGRGSEDAEPADAYADQLYGWIGASERALVLEWGAPDASYTLLDGSRVLTWRRTRTMQEPGPIHVTTETRIVDGQPVEAAVTRQEPAIAVEYRCATNFEIDPDGYVVHYTYQGNGCGTLAAP